LTADVASLAPSAGGTPVVRMPTVGASATGTSAASVVEVGRRGVLPQDLAQEVARAGRLPEPARAHRYAYIVEAKVIEQLEHLDSLERFA
jgi:hypothetical protein